MFKKNCKLQRGSKYSLIFFLFFTMLFLSSLISASGITVRLADHGTDVRNSTNDIIEEGNISIYIYDNETDGTEIFNQTFIGGIVNGSVECANVSVDLSDYALTNESETQNS